MHSRGIFDLFWMVRHGRLLHRVRGLTRFLEAHLWRSKRQIRGFFLPQPASWLGTPFAPLRMTTSKIAQNDNFEGRRSGEGCGGVFQLVSYRLTANS
jgi:hypothetical protein